MHLLLLMSGFTLLSAFITAKLEIHIEGEAGWARNLPTWRVKNRFTKLLFGDESFTGYHLWLLFLNLCYLHFPFVVGLPWTLSLELQIFALFCIGVICEDFFWFVLNPAYGFKKFKKEHIHWHREWLGVVPLLYPKVLATAFVLFLVSVWL